MKEWSASTDNGSTAVEVSEEGISVRISDDDVQRNYSKTIPLADYAEETPTDGWVTIQSIVHGDLKPHQRVEVEAYIAELLGEKS